jgi:histidinol-phosphatase (PHP family)
MTLSLPDYHVHTERCGHARGRAEEYVAAARERGLSAIGISDHLPSLHGRDPELSMALEDLDAYVAEVLELKRRYPGYVLLGIEADYRPDTVDALPALLASQSFDYVIGSVHHVDGWGFDDPRQKELWQGKDVDKVYRRYLELVSEAAECGLFTILGHLDLVKKWGHRPSDSLTAEVERLAGRVAAAEVAVELNTSGLRKPVGEIYPGLAMLEPLARQGVAITFGSDSHRPEDVGKDFELALRSAHQAGFSRYLVLRGREGRRADQVLLPLPESCDTAGVSGP